MNVITRKRIRDFATRHVDAAWSLEYWHRVTQAARWQSLDDVRHVFPHTDLVRVGSCNEVTVFNIAGNRFRFVTAIHYNPQQVYVLRILLQGEYDCGCWKDALTIKLASRRRRSRKADDDYAALVREFPLRPIRHDGEYRAAAALIDRLAARPEERLTSYEQANIEILPPRPKEMLTNGEEAYRDTLALLVEDYDDRMLRETATKLTPQQLLKYLMAEKGMRPVDVANVVGGNAATASYFIDGESYISKNDYRNLAAYFKLDPGLFHL